MKSKVLARFGAWPFVLLGATSSALWAQSYTIVDIGSLNGGNTVVRKINLTGQTVGGSGKMYGVNIRAFISAGGSFVSFEIVPGGNYSSAFDINQSGAVVGESNTATVIRAFLWDA